MNAKTPRSTTDLDALPLHDDTEARQFILRVGEYRARMEYDRSSGDRIFLTHIDVPQELEDQDVASVLTEKVLRWAEDNKFKVVPYCPYAKTYLRRHTSWQRLLVKGVQL